MNFVHSVLLGVGIILLIRVALHYSSRAFPVPKRSSASSGEAESSKSFDKLLYFLFVIFAASMPAVSFVVASRVKAHPREFWIYTLMAIGILISLPLSLLIARLRGRMQYESYWQYLESLSKINRKAISWTWGFGVLVVFGIGVLSLIHS